MDIAVVTGASSGLGLAISRRLLDLGFRVYGLGGNYTESTIPNVDFRPMSCDLADPGHVEARIKEILGKEGAITVLVNNAKYYPPEDFAEGAPAEFSRSLNVNLLCPLVLARWCLEGLRRTRGCVVNISSATPETSRGGPVGACAAGGLRWMQEALFQQLREDGVAVSTIYPEPNRWRPEDAPPPPSGERPQSAIDPQAVAEALMAILHHGRSNVLTEVVIRPERLVERTIPAVRDRPYPKPKPIPYTVPREQIEAEERADREEEERELGLGDRPTRIPAKERAEQTDRGDRSERPTAAENGGAPKKRRRRGRGRGRDREKDDAGERPPEGERAVETGERQPRDGREDEARAPREPRQPRDSREPREPRDSRESRERQPQGERRDARPEGPREPRRDEHRRDPRDESEPRREERRRSESSPPATAEPKLAGDRPEREDNGGSASEGRRSRRRRGRKPRPPSIAGGESLAPIEPRPGPIAAIPAASPVVNVRPEPAPAPKPAPREERSTAPEGQPSWAQTVMPKPSPAAQPARDAPSEVATKASRPAAGKQPVKKSAARKTATTKKTPTKKTPAKKAAVKKTVAKKAARKRTAKKTDAGSSPSSGE